MLAFYRRSLLVTFALWCCLAVSVDSASNSSAALVASNTCQQLVSTLGSSIVQSQSSGSEYTVGANGAWSVFNQEENFLPTCIVFVNSTEDVQTAMKTIFDNKSEYAVQAGGHSAMTGWNTVTDGVLISFMNMNATSYDEEKDTITMQPGILWGAAMTLMETFGVAPVGGRITNVGTGLMLGGGLSYLSPAFGYAADNYVSLDVVLVNGTMVTATVDNEYSDLFKALKGGGNRFGIVTRYEVQAAHVGTAQDKIYWGGIALYPNSSAEAVLTAIAHFSRDTNNTNAVLATDFISVWSNSSVPELTIQLEMNYNGSVEGFNESFAEFLSIPYTSASFGPLSYSDLVNEVSFPDGQGNLFGGSVLEGIASASNSSVDAYLETFQLFNNFSMTFASSSDVSSTLLSFTPVLESQIQYGYAKGGNAISPPMNGGFNEVLFGVTFSQGVTQVPDDIQQGREFFLSNAPSTPGLPLFINECDANQLVFASYGGYEFLQEVYSKYDPTGFNIQYTQGPVGL
ncbi:FAD-binding domain-containing protein [Lentinula aciculospora]|uniref:FAD-binding domain-containing protein n=1 Tax=Lentinula aciculospora TaxID=153920 RepID=A0A9W9DXJ9_9AGAR|nr:FAD-binding domain-containing protein [Lentinula aciculospora]